MPKLQGLIFDLDGTLVDSAPDMLQAMNKTLAGEGRRGLTLDEMKSFTGDGMLLQLQRALAATGEAYGDEASYRLFQTYLNNYRSQEADTSQLYPHVVEMLDGFMKDGIKIGLCTNKQEAATLRLLKELDLERYFNFIAGGDTFPHRKPHPDHIIGVIQKLGVPPGSCIMIGDSMNDTLAASGAGIPCIVVTHGYGDAFADLGANALIDGFLKLRPALTQLGFSN